jgi:hypothetical protein
MKRQAAKATTNNGNNDHINIITLDALMRRALTHFQKQAGEALIQRKMGSRGFISYMDI